VLVRIRNGLDPALDAQKELAANVHVGTRRAHRVGRNQDSLDHLVRISLDEDAILEGAGLALVRVHAEIAHSFARHEGPLQPRGKASASAAPQARGLDHGDKIRRRVFAEGLAERLIPARGEIRVDRVGAGQIGPLEQNGFPGRDHVSLPSAARRAVRPPEPASRGDRGYR